MKKIKMAIKKMMRNYLYRFASLPFAHRVAQGLIPWMIGLSILLLSYGTVMGLYGVPSDYQQLDAFRIMYVHVPAAIWSLGIYSFIFIQSTLFLIWRIKLCDIIADSSAAIGASYTFIALVTGAIWGKPMWGTWWIWDARLTSELLLLFLYLGYMGLRSAIRDSQQRAKLSAVLAIVGMVDVPIIHFSVEWWTTLHQGASITKFAKPSIAPEMLMPLLAMIFGFATLYVLILLLRGSAKIQYMSKVKAPYQASLNTRSLHTKNLSGESIT